MTSPLLPELVTEGDSAQEALANVHDALAAVLELYNGQGRSVPGSLELSEESGPVWLETVAAAP